MVQRIGFPPVLPDNEVTYLNYMEGLIASVDQDADMVIMKKVDGIGVRISPSSAVKLPVVFDVVKKFHTMLGIHVEVSKSMKLGNNVTFDIKY